MLKKLSFTDEVVDIVTPTNEVLSAKYKRSFAYITVRDRLPITITNVIDLLVRDKDKIIDEFGELAKEEIKEVIGQFSKLKNELQTNKPFQLLTSDGSDVPAWNAYYERETDREGEVPRWFRTSWIYAECYMYRRIRETFELSSSLKTFDPFRKSKEEAFHSSVDAMAILGDYVLQQLQAHGVKRFPSSEMKKVALWGNQYDLSRPVGSELPEENDPLKNIQLLSDHVLVDESEKMWSVLEAAAKHRESITIDIVADNAGYELFADMCLADTLCAFSLATKIRFYVKTMPWFISDTMEKDFHWMRHKLLEFSNEYPNLADLANRWEEHLNLKKWYIEVGDFWTLPHVYSEMKTADHQLYDKLSDATLIIFKGDLNYRKLLGETNWAPTESFSNALQGFHPAPLVTLRTIKADLICGLKPGQAEATAAKSEKWLITGDYALIQFDG
ncbi:hypothetical protein L9F63_018286 [Diploptera punctata]|uniref:Sugar phosphate phosphatase n=1 Tax=Diploptera punctata TaxID=6984 RepID=A0AAD7ZXA5_DIPPU|nr:hypothetical protein L9F63_018286 [Diploptera punctata]